MAMIQVHRFRDKVAVYVGKGETVYIDPKEARAFAKALNACARSVTSEKFSESTFKTFELKVSGERT